MKSIFDGQPHKIDHHGIVTNTETGKLVGRLRTPYESGPVTILRPALEANYTDSLAALERARQAYLHDARLNFAVNSIHSAFHSKLPEDLLLTHIAATLLAMAEPPEPVVTFAGVDDACNFSHEFKCTPMVPVPDGMTLDEAGKALAAHLGLLAAAKAALSHVSELRDAWRRGLIDDRNVERGSRSNRNAKVESGLVAAIRKAEQGEP